MEEDNKINSPPHPKLLFEKSFLKENGFLGVGGSANVYSAKYCTLNIALKRNKDSFGDHIDHLIKEYCIMSLIKHPSLPRFLGIVKDDSEMKKIELVYEKINGNVLEYLYNNLYKNNSNNTYFLNTISDLIVSNKKDQSDGILNNYSSVKEKDLTQCFSNPTEPYHLTLLINFIELANIMIFHHQSNLIHRDIKPSNIMIDSISNKAILLDFGISIKAQHTQTKVHTGGTISYMAPENFKQYSDEQQDTSTVFSIISTKVDIWAIGCILSQIFSGEVPWNKFNQINLMLKLSKMANYGDKIKFLIPTVIKDSIPDIHFVIKKCLENDPQKRINAFVLKYYLVGCIYSLLSKKKQGMERKDKKQQRKEFSQLFNKGSLINFMEEKNFKMKSNFLIQSICVYLLFKMN